MARKVRNDGLQDPDGLLDADPWHEMTDQSAIGAVGKVLVATRGSNGSGEVLLTIGGVRECFIADSDGPIERGQTVMVVDVAPHRHVTVVPWMDFPVPQ